MRTPPSPTAPIKTNKQEKVWLLNFMLDHSMTKRFVNLVLDWMSNRNNDLCPVRVILNSGGGDIQQALNLAALFSELRRRGHYLTIQVVGRAASCACWLVQFADWRVIDTYAWLMFHLVSNKVSDDLAGLEKSVEWCRMLQDQTARYLLKRTKKVPREELDAWIADGDKYISSAEALAANLVDEVVYMPRAALLPENTAYEKVFFFNGGLEQDEVADFEISLLSWMSDSSNDNQPVRIMFSSPGGSYFQALGLLGILCELRRRNHHLTMHQVGQVARAAAYLPQAGDFRMAEDSAWTTILKVPSLGDTDAELELRKRVQEQVDGVLTLCTSKLTPSTVKGWKREKNLSAAACLEYGLLDQVLTAPPYPDQLAVA